MRRPVAVQQAMLEGEPTPRSAVNSVLYKTVGRSRPINGLQTCYSSFKSLYYMF